MRRTHTHLMRGCVLAAAVLAGGCGAGLITGIAASNRGGKTGESRPPDITLSPIVPLVPAPDTTRSVVVANVQIAATATLRVRIDALGTGVDQLNPVAAGQGGSTLITFTLETGPIVARVADPTAADVDGQLSVLVDDRAVAAPVPIVLARQPRAQLVVPAGASELFVSPLGERVHLRVDGLRSSAASDLQLLVTTPDPTADVVAGQPLAAITRVATELRFEPDDGGLPQISAQVPGSTFPVRAELVVLDAVAGLSTTVMNAYYRPDVALALPSQGPTTGGTVLTLIGTALAPYDFTVAGGPPQFDFGRVFLSFAKGDGTGERVTELPRPDFRTAESDSDRLVFTMPAAPDGRAGQVDIILRVGLGDVFAEVVASQVFLFANPDPFFGPRGMVLDRLPVAIAPIALDRAPSTDVAPDFAALTDQGGVAFLQLLLAQQNGMFQAFAAPRQIGDPEALAEREPRDLCVGDFDGDGVPDVFVVNAGATLAVHHLVLGQAAPLPPLGVVHRFGSPGGMYRGRAARLDGDTVPDVLLVPGPGAASGQRPVVLLARPLGHGQPGFDAPVPVAVRDFAYEAVEVADIDGDGALDIAVVSGSEGKLDIAYGLGDGTFPNVVSLDFTVPNYTFDPASPAVGLHACGDVPQSLGLVLAGVDFVAGQTAPTVAVLRQVAFRTFDSPSPAETFFAPTDPIGRSLVADLDQSPPVEMVLAIRGEPELISLGLLQLTAANGFLPIKGSLEGGLYAGAEVPKNIRALAFDRAYPPAQGSDSRAVFVVHEADVDGATERRLSTRLVVSAPPAPPKLLPPDAGEDVSYGIQAVVAGNFRGVPKTPGGSFDDAALARTVPSETILLVNNGGVPGLPAPGNQVDFPGLLPNSTTVLPAPSGVPDALVFAARDSRLGAWRPSPKVVPDAVTGPLRAAVDDPVLQGTDLADTTRVRRGDVDGDGIDDLVVLLSFAIANPGEGQAAIALLRGKANPGPDEFPFHEPTSTTPVHGRASAIELGDFTRGQPEQIRRLELAVAVPQGTGAEGDHVRFFRYQAGATPAGDHFVPAAAASGPQVLLAGSRPTQLAAADFDRDGSIDLLVACAGDNTLRLFRNAAPIAPGATAVEVAAFSQVLGSPWTMAVGAPTALRLSDVNGDGSLDAVAFVETLSGGVRGGSVGIYLSSGAGSFDGPRRVSPTRVGGFNGALSGDLGDWNRDGLPDLLLGWDATPGINLRILFGGTR